MERLDDPREGLWAFAMSGMLAEESIRVNSPAQTHLLLDDLHLKQSPSCRCEKTAHEAPAMASLTPDSAGAGMPPQVNREAPRAEKSIPKRSGIAETVSMPCKKQTRPGQLVASHGV